VNNIFTDSRFCNACLQHRLRNCGLSNVIYLVEEYGSMDHFKIPEETLNQAIVNTQVCVVIQLL